FLYASSYAVLASGGLAAPRHPIPQSWIDLRAIPEHPFAGDAALFRFPRHAPGFTHFLVRTCAGQGCVPDPLVGRPEVRLLVEQRMRSSSTVSTIRPTSRYRSRRAGFNQPAAPPGC